MEVFFTGDTHFRHANIIIYCKRPYLQDGDTYYDCSSERVRWASNEIKLKRNKEMTDDLVKRWNDVVSTNDTVYHVGDFGWFEKPEHVEAFLKRLNGNIYLIQGNHDRPWIKQVRSFKWVSHPYQGKMVKIDNQNIFLYHTACRVWDKSHHGSWHLYGHSHGSLSELPNMKEFDVGIDNHPEHRPFHFDEIKSIMKDKHDYTK